MQDFEFQISDWRRALLPRTDIPPAPPTGTGYRMALDPSFFAESGGNGINRSDESAYSVGFIGDDSDLTLVDNAAGLWRGLDLPEEIVGGIELWHPETLLIERAGNGAPDLLKDCIRFLCDMHEVSTPRIEFFTPRSPKAHRIRRLQDLLDANLLHIHQGAFVSDLFLEVESFDFSSRDNHGRSDNRLDSLAALCGYR